MKRLASLFLGLLVALGVTACTPGKVMIKPDQPIKRYGSLNIVVTSQNFLNTIKGSEKYDNYVALAAESDKLIQGHMANWAAKNWVGTKGNRALTVRVDLKEYNTGSAAAKIFLGGMANGKVVYQMDLVDGSKVIGSYLFPGEVSLMGSNAAFWGMAKQMESRIAATE